MYVPHPLFICYCLLGLPFCYYLLPLCYIHPICSPTTLVVVVSPHLTYNSNEEFLETVFLFLFPWTRLKLGFFHALLLAFTPFIPNIQCPTPAYPNSKCCFLGQPYDGRDRGGIDGAYDGQHRIVKKVIYPAQALPSFIPSGSLLRSKAPLFTFVLRAGDWASIRVLLDDRYSFNTWFLWRGGGGVGGFGIGPWLVKSLVELTVNRNYYMSSSLLSPPLFVHSVCISLCIKKLPLVL